MYVVTVRAQFGRAALFTRPALTLSLHLIRIHKVFLVKLIILRFMQTPDRRDQQLVAPPIRTAYV